MSTRDAGQVRGHPNTDTSQRSDLSFVQATAQKVGSGRGSLEVLANAFFQLVASDTAETGSTASSIVATSHTALPGDILVFTSGNLNRVTVPVFAKSANAITPGVTLSEAPANGDGFDILRISYPRINSAGALSTTVSSGSVTADTEMPAAAALADNTSNPTAPAVGSFQHVWDGSAWDRAPGTSADGTLVNLGANNDVTVTSSALPTGASTLAEQQTQTTALQLIDDVVHASDAAISKYAAVGGRAQLSGEPTAVGTAGDLVGVMTDGLGRAVTSPFITQDKGGVSSTSLTNTTEASLRTASATERNYAAWVSLSNADAATATIFDILNGSGGSVLFRARVPANTTVHYNFDPIHVRTDLNTAMYIKQNASVTLYIDVGYYRSTQG